MLVLGHLVVDQSAMLAAAAAADVQAQRGDGGDAMDVDGEEAELLVSDSCASTVMQLPTVDGFSDTASVKQQQSCW